MQAAAAMRCICDPEVNSRAVCCVKGKDGEPGSLNFDLEDDIGTLSGGKALLDNMMRGAFSQV